jgi:hypothetical protein
MIIRHPRTEEFMERTISRTPEAEELQNAICMAMSAYEDYLERSGVCHGAWPRLPGHALDEPPPERRLTDGDAAKPQRPAEE